MAEEVCVPAVAPQGIYRVHWVEHGAAAVDFTIDESECLGDKVHLVAHQRLFGVPEHVAHTTAITIIPRHAWEELMRGRNQA